jgi:hypothetical protein
VFNIVRSHHSIERNDIGVVDDLLTENNEAGFYYGDARQKENYFPKPKELASLKLASSSMA